MFHIVILSASMRTGRKSHRVALYFNRFIAEKSLATSEIVDLADYAFPLFEERLQYQTDPLPAAIEFASKINNADGVIIVTPEYNGGYPASLKNAIDLLTTEWFRKPVAISTASDGIFGGTQVITSLQFSLWKMKAWTVPAMFPVPSLTQTFSENGVPADVESTGKRALSFIQELLWCVEARKRMNPSLK